jgi:hypothetical protein
MSLSAASRSHYLAVVALLDQLDPKLYNWPWLLVILDDQSVLTQELIFLVNGPKLSMKFSGMLSKFLMDRNRAGSLWVNPQMYVNLAIQLLNILHDK